MAVMDHKDIKKLIVCKMFIMMKQNSQTLREGNYEAPAASVMELETEGVLCASGTNEEWNEGMLPE